MLGADYSSKFSPWLAHGCLSARQIALECHNYEQQRVANKSTYWMIFELLWRDYCKFFAYKHGDVLFYPGGTAGKADYNWSTYEKNFEAWKEGKTGYPLVDANMRELRATGFMSNRGRQNVASYLAIDLNYDWRCGGDFFETHLLDYDVYSNWVNWCMAAGMTGGRVNRFNIVKQSKDYDLNGDYVRHWLPELKDVPKQFIHEPWKMTQFQQMESNCMLGVAYPNPVTMPSQPAESYQGQKGTNAGERKQTRSTKPNKGRNPHQRYEMKSVRQGRFDMK
jgi:deoxyribodipyrimidine photo-lyase